MFDFSEITSFQWDRGNLEKSQQKHGVRLKETEEIFLDENVLFVEDVKHSQKEQRYIAIGQTAQKVVLLVVFTFRGKRIRVISARHANKKERSEYEKTD